LREHDLFPPDDQPKLRAEAGKFAVDEIAQCAKNPR
jgi:hypothetical protein